MDQAPETSIVYEDDEIRVIWSPAPSDIVLITFGDLYTTAHEHRFFADVPLRKSGIAAIGIMPKRGNWFPAPSLRQAAAAILERTRGHATRMTYGGSMGGYGALKFSRLLEATHVIALCPQWSLDAAECRGLDLGWQEYFEPAMHGMGIREHDVGGAMFLFADTLDVWDRLHCEMILENCPGAHLVDVPVAQHQVTSVFAGTSNLLELIAACRAGDLTELRRFSRRTRRRHPIWQDRILRHALRRLPRLGTQLLAGADHQALVRDDWRCFPPVLSHLAAGAGGAARAAAFYDGARALVPGPVEQHLVCAYLAGIAGGRVGIATAHASWLIYDLSENVVCHRAARRAAWQMPVEVEFADAAAHLYVTIGSARVRLSVDAEGWLAVDTAQRPGERGFAFAIGPGDPGEFTLGHGGRYVSAQLGRAIICNRDGTSAWEMFRFGLLDAG